MVCPPRRAIATVKLTRVRVEALEKISPNTLPSRRGLRRPALISAARVNSAWVWAPLKSAEERKSCPFRAESSADIARIQTTLIRD